MRRPGQRRIAASRVTWVLASLAVVLPGLGCGDREPTSLAEILGGQRHVGPALVGLAESGDCTVSDDFIPRIRCGTTPDRDRLRRLESKLLAELGSRPEPKKLRESAVVRLAGDPESKRVRQAAALLSEALKDEADPHQQAELLTDLSAAYLLQAETDQSAMELAFALDSALQALELDPSSEAAAFNKRLALILLGVERADPSVDGELLVAVSRNIFDTRADPGEETCIPAREARQVLDNWSATVMGGSTPSSPPSLPRCLLDEEDRWFSEILAAAIHQPDSLAREWMLYRDAQSSIRDFSAGERRDDFAKIARNLSTDALRVAMIYPIAVGYLRSDSIDQATELLRSLLEKARDRSYFGQAARASHLLAAIEGGRARFGDALILNRNALQLAERSGFADLSASILGQELDLLYAGGQEDAAWRTTAAVLRNLPSHSRRASLAQLITARLARERRLQHVAVQFFERSLALREGIPPAGQVEALLNNAEFQLELHRSDRAASLYLRAEALVDSVDSSSRSAQVEANLSYFRALTTENAVERLDALQEARRTFEAIGYSLRDLELHHHLGRTSIELGQLTEARQYLERGLEILTEQANAAGSWPMASAVVFDGRPLVDLLVGIELDSGRKDAVIPTLAKYVGLRAGRHETAPPPEGAARVTTFVRDEELILGLESVDAEEILRIPVSRERLSELRSLLITQLQTGISEAQIEATLSELSRSLIEPVPEAWFRVNHWIVVADDVLTGLPFALLPRNDGVLLDELAVSYSSDHRARTQFRFPERMTIVGSEAGLEGMPDLPKARSEAVAIGSTVPGSRVLIDEEAKPERLLRELDDSGLAAGSHGLHIAGHFVVNLRSPMDSAVILRSAEATESPRATRLPVEQLLDKASGPRLMYISACETGSKLPPAPHGLQGMAQAFTSSGVDTAVLSLWRLDDQIASAIAVSFYQNSWPARHRRQL